MPGIRIRKAEIADPPRLTDTANRPGEPGTLPILTDNPGMREAERRRLSHAVGHGWRHTIVAEIDDDLADTAAFQALTRPARSAP